MPSVSLDEGNVLFTVTGYAAFTIFLAFDVLQLSIVLYDLACLVIRCHVNVIFITFVYCILTHERVIITISRSFCILRNYITRDLIYSWQSCICVIKINFVYIVFYDNSLTTTSNNELLIYTSKQCRI